MKRKTRNVALLEVVKRQEAIISHLQGVIKALELQEKKRDDAWSQFTDERIREINIAIRRTNNV